MENHLCVSLFNRQEMSKNIFGFVGMLIEEWFSCTKHYNAVAISFESKLMQKHSFQTQSSDISISTNWILKLLQHNLYARYVVVIVGR